MRAAHADGRSFGGSAPDQRAKHHRQAINRNPGDAGAAQLPPAWMLSKLPSFTRPEDARAVAYQRLDRRLGAVTPDELAAVRRILRAFLDL